MDHYPKDLIFLKKMYEDGKDIKINPSVMQQLKIQDTLQQAINLDMYTRQEYLVSLKKKQEESDKRQMQLEKAQGNYQEEKINPKRFKNEPIMDEEKLFKKEEPN